MVGSSGIIVNNKFAAINISQARPAESGSHYCNFFYCDKSRCSSLLFVDLRAKIIT